MYEDHYVRIEKEYKSSLKWHLLITGSIAAVTFPSVPLELYFAALLPLTLFTVGRFEALQKAVYTAASAVSDGFDKVANALTFRKKKEPDPIQSFWNDPHAFEKATLNSCLIDYQKKLGIDEKINLVFVDKNDSVAEANPIARKITLSTYLFSQYTLDEVKTILAHETGHIKMTPNRRDELYLLGLGSLALLSCFCGGIQQSSLLLGMAEIFVGPAAFCAKFNHSKKVELLADSYGVLLTENALASISQMEKINEDNKSHGFLNRLEMKLFNSLNWICTHPKDNIRIETMRKLGTELGLMDRPSEAINTNKPVAKTL